MATRVYGGGMFAPPVIIHNGGHVPLKSPFEAIATLAIDFFKWVGSVFSNCFSNSNAEERRPLARGETHVAQRVTVPKVEVGVEDFERSILRSQVTQYHVGTDEEPRRDYFSEKPLIGEKIKSTSSLYEVGKTGIHVQREFAMKLESGFARYDVIGSDGKSFVFDGDPQTAVQLITDWVGVSSEEAFNGLTSSNPVSVFQILIQQHFDPTTQKESKMWLPLGMQGLQEYEPVQKGQLTLLPSQGDGGLRFKIETDLNIGKLGEDELVKSYRVTQNVTIRSGEPCQVTVERSAQAK